MSAQPGQQAGRLSQPPALRLQDRFTDVQAPLLHVQHAPAPPLWGLGLFGSLLALVVSLLLVAPLPGGSSWPPKWQLRVAAALGLLGATGCLEGHLISLQKQLRRQGFLAVYRRLKRLSRFPLLITTAGTAGLVLLLLGSGRHQLDQGWQGGGLRLLLAGEALALAAVLGSYCAVLLRRQQGVPDADVASWVRSPLHPAPPPPHPPRSPTAAAAPCATGVVDRQAELLRFQEERLHHLGGEVLRLQDALAAGGVQLPLSGRAGTQADLEYWLAAREQELRTVAAERDVLASEVRGVRALLAEAEAEVARLRSGNKQHAEENARLRAMRDEWSARSAKLEQTLLTVQAGTGSYQE